MALFFSSSYKNAFSYLLSLSKEDEILSLTSFFFDEEKNVYFVPSEFEFVLFYAWFTLYKIFYFFKLLIVLIYLIIFILI